MVKSYDVVVVGSGSGGQTAAYTLMEYGLSVAVVENSATPGGICALAGCQAKNGITRPPRPWPGPGTWRAKA